MKKVLARAGLAVAGMTVALAASAVPADGQVPYTYGVSIDARGLITEVRAPAGVPAATDAVLREHIQGVRLVPHGSGNGEEGRSHVRFVVEDRAHPRVVSMQSGAAPLQWASPEYPRRAQSAGNEGVVVLSVEVAADGSVASTQVLQVQGDVTRDMASAALAASRGWRFSPERVAGRPVAASLLVPVCYFISRNADQACSWQRPDNGQWMAGASIVDRRPAFSLAAGAIAYQSEH